MGASSGFKLIDVIEPRKSNLPPMNADTRRQK